MTTLRIIAAILICVVAVPAFAQDKPADNMDIVRDAIAAQKKLLIAENLPLTEGEASAFWPIYEEFQVELKKIADSDIKLIEEFAKYYNSDTMTDEIAEKLIKDSMANDGARLKLKDKYFSKFLKAVPAKKVARYYQLENKVRAVVNYDLAAQIPLVD
jgi:hypothetical protein